MKRLIASVCLMFVVALFALACIFGVRHYRTKTGQTARVRELKQSVAAKCGESLLATLNNQFSIDVNKGMSYANSLEHKHVSQLLIGVIEEWVENELAEWTHVDEKRGFVFILLHSCGRISALGRELVQTENDLQIAQRAVEKYNESYMDGSSKLRISMNKDGDVSVGILTRY